MPPEPCCRLHPGQFLQVEALRFVEEEKERQRSADHVRFIPLPIRIPKPGCANSKAKERNASSLFLP